MNRVEWIDARRVGLLVAAVASFAACDREAREPAPEQRVAALGATPRFSTFESGQVRPMALSPSGDRLFVANTPDGSLEVYKVNSTGALEHKLSIPVGLEPVAVAARSETEVWVVNHLSDSVSIVSFHSTYNGYVSRTLLVGDEPRDVVFAGANRARAFITTAHRGQNSPIDPQLTEKSVGRADVWVFDSGNLGATLGGTPLEIVTLYADTPRALAVSPDGSKVYAAAFASGNKTTVTHRFIMPTTEAAGGPAEPNTNHANIPQPNTGLIVKHDGSHWVDELGRSFDAMINFTLADKDVFAIDALASPPAEIAGTGGVYTGVGTTIFNMAVNPVSGKVYVSNTEARNEVRFEGAGTFSGSSLGAHLVDSRISILDGGAVTHRNLNKHINYATCCAAIPNTENSRSLAFPVDMVVSADGSRLYVAALGSNKVGVFDTQELETDTFVPDTADHITLTGGGPTGLALHDAKDRLYVLTRFDNGISTIDTTTGFEIAHVSMFNPEPAVVTSGRRFLYDASYTSSRGDQACASCHTFGDMDHLAWDLGDPDGDVKTTPGPFKMGFFPGILDFHPMKGPMTTQSLRGMANHGAMHWRGDRTGGYHEPSVQPDDGTFDEEEAFRQFNPAFVGLMGRANQLTTSEMQAFADFALQLMYPPNPIRALDNSLNADQTEGREIYMTAPRTNNNTCMFCHRLDPAGNAEFGVEFPGFFGTEGFNLPDALGQSMKIPHLRNIYQKVGMYGMIYIPLLNEELDAEFAGDQIRGFGFTHDGTTDTVERFHAQGVDFGPGPFDDFNPNGFTMDEAGRAQRRKLGEFLFAYDSNHAPIVGQQITLTTSNGTAVGPRIDLLVARSLAGECELVAKAYKKGWLHDGQVFVPDTVTKSPVTDTQLRATVHQPKDAITYTCVPMGSGRRMGLDRDLDGVLDRDEP